MATTEQRSGFRLPWASDAHSGTRAPDRTPPVDGAAPNPDGLSGDASAAVATPETTEPTAAAAPAAEGDLVQLNADSGADGSASDAVLVSPVSHDPTVAPAQARRRRDNALVSGLVRAMRDAAAAAREETAARFAEDAKARVEAIHARSTGEAAELRRQADAEIVKIREWSKAETARIREETDRRITARRRRLEADVEAHSARVGRRIEAVHGATREFERRMDAFFKQLLAEEDPARLAGLAEQLPEPPSLEIAEVDDGDPADPAATLDASGAARAEAEALADLDGIDAGDEAPLGPSRTDDGPELSVASPASGPAPAADSAGLPEAATSTMAVIGLVSVASIAGFKRAIARTQGVRSVAVASGPGGDFIFTIAHDPATDLRSAVPTLGGFSAVITGDADGVIAVRATDPDANQ